jgi:PAS domain-containing protein
MAMNRPYIKKPEQIEDECRQTKDGLIGTQRLMLVGYWEWNLETKKYGWCDEMYRIFKLMVQQFPPRTGTFFNCIHPEDRGKVVKALGKALVGEQPYNIDHRIVWPDGSVRIVHGEAEVTFDKRGRPIHMLGKVLDITDGRQV